MNVNLLLQEETNTFSNSTSSKNSTPLQTSRESTIDTIASHLFAEEVNTGHSTSLSSSHSFKPSFETVDDFASYLFAEVVNTGDTTSLSGSDLVPYLFDERVNTGNNSSSSSSSSSTSSTSSTSSNGSDCVRAGLNRKRTLNSQNTGNTTKRSKQIEITTDSVDEAAFRKGLEKLTKFSSRQLFLSKEGYRVFLELCKREFEFTEIAYLLQINGYEYSLRGCLINPMWVERRIKNIFLAKWEKLPSNYFKPNSRAKVRYRESDEKIKCLADALKNKPLLNVTEIDANKLHVDILQRFPGLKAFMDDEEIEILLEVCREFDTIEGIVDQLKNHGMTKKQRRLISTGCPSSMIHEIKNYLNKLDKKNED